MTQVRYIERREVEIELPRSVDPFLDGKIALTLSEAVGLFYKLRDELRRAGAIEE